MAAVTRARNREGGSAGTSSTARARARNRLLDTASIQEVQPEALMGYGHLRRIGRSRRCGRSGILGKACCPMTITGSAGRRSRPQQSTRSGQRR